MYQLSFYLNQFWVKWWEFQCGIRSNQISDYRIITKGLLRIEAPEALKEVKKYGAVNGVPSNAAILAHTA